MARKRGNSWQGSLKTPEKYYRYSFPTEALAEEWERVAREAKKAGQPIPEPDLQDNRNPTLHGFFKEHKADIWPNALTRNTEASQRAVERFIGRDTLLRQITEKKLAQAVAGMRRDGHKPSTINSRLSHLNVLLRYARLLEVVDTLPSLPWVKKEENARMRFLTEGEEQSLLSLIRHWGLEEDAQLLEALIDTGCRPSELILGESKGEPIRWSEVSVSAGGEAPDVNNPATGEPKAVISLLRTKTGKYRVLPLTDRARNAFLASKQRGDARPFAGHQSALLSGSVRRAADHLGMKDVVLYTMRHTCASRLVQRGADLRRVMEWMGHTNINTTLRYAKLTPTDIFKLEELL